MNKAVFLSAGVPDPRRGPEYAKTADTVAIVAAVSALVHVTLGRRKLVWGGHPAITPMVLVVADSLGIDYGSWVTLYQTRYFEDDFPEDNQRFRNVVYTESVENDREKSLLKMRERMFNETKFDAAVFIGGMGGIIDEFNLFRKFQPKARKIPVITTGGATLNLVEQMSSLDQDISESLDYVTLFHRHLRVSARELRYKSPKEQPRKVNLRYWHPPNKNN